MAFELGSFDVMGYLWETLQKTEDGEHIRYSLHDVDVLWHMGFVDTERVSIKQWRAAFDEYRQSGGGFLLNKGGFLSLDQYRYKGELHIPFDALQINEGQYTDKGLQELFDASIVPSSSLSTAEMTQFVQKLKEDFRQTNGLVMIAAAAKRRVKKLLDEKPSPLRNLELLFDQMISQGSTADASAQVADATARSVAQRIAQETSSFTTAPTSKGEAMASQLQKLTKARPQKLASDPKKKTTELKKIRRSRKGLRG